MATPKERLARLRKLMVEEQIDLMVVRSTDRYLNEYVPENESLRCYITGFNGSMGDALVSADEAHLFVDGRYRLQAAAQAKLYQIHVAEQGLTIANEWIQFIEQYVTQKKLNPCRLFLESDKISAAQVKKLSEQFAPIGVDLVVQSPSLAARAREALKENPSSTVSRLFTVDKRYTGRSTKEKFVAATAELKRLSVDAFFVVLLDEIAWLTNLRGADFPYQSTFAARALVTKNVTLIGLSKKTSKLPRIDSSVRLTTEEELFNEIKTMSSTNAFTIGFDPDETPEEVVAQLEKTGATLVETQSPFSAMKAIKNPVELKHMLSGFVRADHVVFVTQKWLCKRVHAGKKTTERDVDEHITKGFAKSGTIGLSFKPICAAGKNGAVIHYGTPDAKTPIKNGELFLLDTGGLYEGGYATDLTRTFLVGGKRVRAAKQQKFLFTVTLKGAIAGMTARIWQGTTGAALDAIVRQPIWQAGFQFEHGTGHGVGINVHESPPRISRFGHWPLEVGHVFSIEPGVYLPNFGGIRIENLCTVVKDKKHPNFLQVVPLTFAPLDDKLIDRKLLTKQEKKFLQWYKKQFKKIATKKDLPKAFS